MASTHVRVDDDVAETGSTTSERNAKKGDVIFHSEQV